MPHPFVLILERFLAGHSEFKWLTASLPPTAGHNKTNVSLEGFVIGRHLDICFLSHWSKPTLCDVAVVPLKFPASFNDP